MLLFSRQGKLRLQKWYVAHPDKLKKKITRELITTILARKPKMCSFLEWRDLKVVYKRFVKLFRTSHWFACCKFQILDMQVYIFVVQLSKMIMNYWPWKWYTDTWSCLINILEAYVSQLKVTISRSIEFSLGVWAGHYFQFWEGLFYTGWAVIGWWDSGDKQEKRLKGDSCTGSTARG